MKSCKLIGLLILSTLEVSFIWKYVTQNSDIRKILQSRSWQEFCSLCVDGGETHKLHESCMKQNNDTVNEFEEGFIIHKAQQNSSIIEDIYQAVPNCSWLHEYLNNNFYNSETEENFPIAFTIVVHNSPEQILRLIRVLYRKQNSFCIHCDAKSPYTQLFERVSECFDNIVVPPNLTSVVWGHSSILEAQMKCANELATLRDRSEYKWKYLINICGKEVPLATNREMVQTLQRLSGTSNIIARIVSDDETEFYSRFIYPVKLDKDKKRVYYDKDNRLNSSFFNSSRRHYKSSGYHALSFPFVHHLLYKDGAISTRKEFQQCKSPEEHYYATVFMTPGVPGGYSSTKEKLYFKMANSFWVPPHNCSGKVVHRVCVVGAGDIMKVSRYSRGHFFHNKYFMEYDDSVMCHMEKELMERNLKELKFDCGRNCFIMGDTHIT